MKTSPFKVMTTAALATALAVPAVATTVDAAEVELKQIAFELNGEVQVVDFNDYVDAIVSESGELYDFVNQASPAAIGVGEGSFVSYQALVNAIIDDEEGKTGKEVLAEVSTNEEALVSEDTVAEYKTFGEEEDVAPEVTSVNTPNNIQAELTFNTSLDEETVVADNFTEDSASLDIASVKLVDSNKVLVTFNGGFDNQDKVELTVNDLKSEAGLTIEDDTTANLSFFDTTPPEVESVVSAGPDKFKVIFSEPVTQNTAEDTANYSINDGQYFIQSATQTSLNEVTVDLYSTLTEGEYDVTVSGVEDYADLNVETSDLTLDQIVDEDAPNVVDVTTAKPSKLVLEFNEDITLTDAAANLLANVYHTNSGNTPNSIQVKDGNTLELTFTSNPLPEGSAYLTIEEDVLEDGWNNQNDEINRTVDVVVDDVKPEFTKLESSQDTKFSLTFSEDVTSATAQDEDNYTILDPSGEEVEEDFTAVRDTTDNNIVNITMDNPLSGGVYTVVVANLEDTSGNEVNETSLSAELTDSSKPSVTGTATLYANEQIVKVEFSEPMATSGEGSVLDLSNYQYGSTFLDDTKASITLTDSGKAVLIDLGDEDTITPSNNDTLTVGKVEDATGNPTSSFTTPVTLQTAQNVGVSSVEATAVNTVVVTLDDTLSNFKSDDFDLYDSNNTEITPAAVTFKNVDGKGVITYTLKSGDELTADADNNTVSVGTNGDIQSENSFGVLVGSNIGPVSADDKVAPELNTNVSPVVQSTGNGTYDVTLTFTENVEGSAEAAGTFFDVEDFTFETATGTLADDEYKLSYNQDKTVTFSVYAESEDELDLALESNKYFTDDQSNQVKDFSVTVDVYGGTYK